MEEEDKKSFEEIWSTLTKEQSKYLKDYINRQREGAIKWQQERSYSEEDLEIAFKNGFVISYGINDIDSIDRKDELFKEWFEQFKKKIRL